MKGSFDCPCGFKGAPRNIRQHRMSCPTWKAQNGTQPTAPAPCSDGYLWIIDDGYAPRLACSEGACEDITLEMVFGTLPVPDINQDEARKIIDQCREFGGCNFEDGFIRWQRVARQNSVLSGPPSDKP